MIAAGRPLSYLNVWSVNVWSASRRSDLDSNFPDTALCLIIRLLGNYSRWPAIAFELYESVHQLNNAG